MTGRLTWFITGCASGIGHELVQVLLERGDRVIATARKAEERLQDLKTKGATIMELDVAWSQDKINEVAKKAIAVHGGIDVLVNNAASFAVGMLEETSFDELYRSMETNCWGPVRVMKAFFPHFREKKAGINAVVGSISGWVGTFGTSPYCASKFALEGIVECVQEETAAFGIKTIQFEPGRYQTRIFHPDNAVLAQGDIADYSEQRNTINNGVQMFHNNQPGDPRKAAERIADVIRLEGLAKGKTEMPARLPLGGDGIDWLKKKCDATLDIIKEWGDIARATDREGMDANSGYDPRAEKKE